MMNQAKDTIIDWPPTDQVRGTEPPPAKAGSDREALYYRDGELQKVGKIGRINRRLVCLVEPRSERAESYFRLRHMLEQLRRPDEGIVVGVTSPGEGDGKTLTAINLAGALAQDTAARVLLVDLNLRQSRNNVSDYLDLGPGPVAGVADWIKNDEDSSEGLASYHLPDFNLHLMPAGTHVDSPYELLKSPRLGQLLEQARQRYDYIVVDTPQTLQLPDVELIAGVIDGFLIVVRADSTPQEKLEETLNLMTQEKVLGLVLNSVSASS